MAMKFRRAPYDAPEPAPVKPVEKPDTLPPNKLGVFDHRGQRVGVMGRAAGLPTAARFLGHNNARLGKVDNRDAWIANAPRKPTGADARHARNLKTAKGSVTDHPSAPKTTARPKRG